MLLDYSSDGQAAHRTNPPYPGYIDVLANYVDTYSGGADGFLLHEISGYVAGTVRDATAIRLCGGQFIQGLANFKSANKLLLPHVCTALMMAQLTCPTIKVVNGMCVLMNSSHLRKLICAKEKNERTLHIEFVLKNAKKLVETVAIDNAKKIKLVGTLGVRLVLHNMGLGRDSADKKNWESMKEITEVAIYVLII